MRSLLQLPHTFLRQVSPPRLAVSLVMAGICALTLSCNGNGQATAPQKLGDAEAGKLAIRHYGCSGCHTIPGVQGANAGIGPPLAGLGRRLYLVHKVRNTPTNLIQWIRNPKSLDPDAKMPILGVTEQDSRNIAAYLYTLR